MQETAIQPVQIPTVRLVAEGFFRHWRLVSVICLGVLLSTAAITLASKKQYRSETKFLLENNRSNTVITPDRSASPLTAEITEQQINSEIEILSSEDVIGAVADPTWDFQVHSGQTVADLKSHDKRLEDFHKHLGIAPVRKSNVIDVSYTAPSPDEATRVLKQFSVAYLSHRELLSRPRGISNFFAEEARRYQDAWKQADHDLVDFQHQHHIVSVQEEEAALKKQALGYEDDLRSTQSSLAETQARQTASERAVRDVPARQKGQEHTVVNETSSEQMRTLLVQLTNRRIELLSRWLPNDRVVVEVDHQIAETKTALAEALSQAGHENTTDINPTWQQAQNSFVEGNIERQGLQAKNDSISKSLAALYGRLAMTQTLGVQFNALQEKADQARSNFELFSEKRDQAQIEDAMDQQKLVNIAIAESPTESFQPISPKLLLNGALGVVTALFLGIAAVYFAESTRNTVGSPRELEMLSRFPVLATMPRDSAISIEPQMPHSKRVKERMHNGSTLSHIGPVMQNLNESTPVAEPHAQTGGFRH